MSSDGIFHIIVQYLFLHVMNTRKRFSEFTVESNLFSCLRVKSNYWVKCHYRCFTANRRVSQHEESRQTAGCWLLNGVGLDDAKNVFSLIVFFVCGSWLNWMKIQIHVFLHVLRGFLLCWGVWASVTHKDLQPWPTHKEMTRPLLVLPHSPH